MRIIGAKPISESEQYTEVCDFEDGDLIVPQHGVMYSFKWKDGAELDCNFKYHKANSAEENYFYKRIYNGYKLVGATEGSDLLTKNFNIYVINYKDL